MNSKHMLAMLCAAAVGSGVCAAESTAEKEETPQGWNYEAGSGISYGETPIVTAEFGLAFDSKFLSYGLVDNNDPILTPSASLTLFDWLTVGVESIFDMTPYGRKKVLNEDGEYEDLYANRGGKYQELDPSISIGHSFSPEDYEWLPTTIEFSLGYGYEYHPRSYSPASDDTQFITFEVALPDLWIEPTLAYERDIDRDDGTYLNLDIGHTFEITDALSIRPGVAQGLGNTRRVKSYIPNHRNPDGELDHGGLMDTCVKIEAEYALTDWLTLGGYVAYSDYLFDRRMREGARDYEGSGDWRESYNFICGLSVTATF